MYINIKKIRALAESESARLKIFGESELTRLQKIKSEARRNESASALLALAEISENVPETKIIRESSGRPFFEGSTVDLSISHSSSLAVAALNFDGKIGVDIEKIDSKRRTVAVAERFFSEKEKKLISKASEPELEFFRLWTKKEAAVKCRNVPLAIDVSSDIFLSDLCFSSYLVICEDEKYVLSIAYDLADQREIITGEDIEIISLNYEV